MDRKPRRTLDAEMLSVWRVLVEDLREVAASKSTLTQPFDHFGRMLADGNMGEIRNKLFPNYFIMPELYAKALRQAEMFGKRWLFDTDVKGQTEIDLLTVTDFVVTQQSVLDDLPDSEIISRVLTNAKALNECILGEYEAEEHKSKCRFGSRAAYGLPRQDAYLFNRIGRLSATQRQVDRWGLWLAEDEQLRAEMKDLVIQGRSNKIEPLITLTEKLNLTVVPKTFKAGRTIVPDTILGGYISNGFGRMIADRLRVNAGLDIRRKQEEHKRIAQAASRTSHLTTADMSKASDNISWPLLQRILPADWLSVVDDDRVFCVSFCGYDVQVKSPLLMGKGYTFPLQTLVFYSLLMSIADQLGIGHKYISVYGDDLIYPTAMHKYVLAVFPQLGLKINVDKTFADKSPKQSAHKGVFRESCGGDYLNGMDIRPYAPMGRSGDNDFGNLNRDENLAMFCYTLLNGLLDRWEPWLIKRTVRHLLIRISSITGEILVVPEESSVSAGLRMDKYSLLWVKAIEETFPIVYPKPVKVYHRSGGYSEIYSFHSYAYPEQRVVIERERLYLWDKLRQMEERNQDEIEVLPHTASLVCVPGYREERLRLQRQKWEAPSETLKLQPKKRYVDRYNRWHDKRPTNEPSQARLVFLPTVVSREVTVRNGKKDRRNVPLHSLLKTKQVAI